MAGPLTEQAGAQLSAETGGAQAPSAPAAGGVEFGVATSAAKRPAGPVVSALSVQSLVAAGAMPRVTLRLDERGVRTVYAGVSVSELESHRQVLAVSIGWTRTGRTLTLRWPKHASLKPGSYSLSVSARDHQHHSLLRNAHASGSGGFTVKPPTPPSPPSVGASAPEAQATPVPGVPTPAQTVAEGAVFPLQGTHNYGNAEDRFGAARGNHIHQGQDVLAAEGTPVVAPLPGTVLWTSYQAGGAGYYVVEHAADGFDLMFAHCQEGSVAVAAEQTLSAGQAVCKVGMTGDATGPHLHFEMWVGGWQAAGGHPIDPLPYLQAWEGAAH